MANYGIKPISNKEFMKKWKEASNIWDDELLKRAHRGLLKVMSKEIIDKGVVRLPNIGDFRIKIGRIRTDHLIRYVDFGVTKQWKEWIKSKGMLPFERKQVDLGAYPHIVAKDMELYFNVWVKPYLKAKSEGNVVMDIQPDLEYLERYRLDHKRSKYEQ